MKNKLSGYRIVALWALISLAILGFAQAQPSYNIAIQSNAPPYSSSATAGPGQSIDMRIVFQNVGTPGIAGSSLYLSYDPRVISNLACVNTIYHDFNNCQILSPGIFLVEGYDTFGNFTGDVVVAVLRLTVNQSASIGSSTLLQLSGHRTGQAFGTPIWSRGGSELGATFSNGMLTVVGQPQPLGSLSVRKTATPNRAEKLSDVTFNIAVKNTGSTTLNNIRVVDTLPQGLTLVNSSPVGTVLGQTVIWDNVSPLPTNSSPAIFRLIARVDQTASGVLTNIVNVTASSPGGTVRGNASARVIVLPLPVKSNSANVQVINVGDQAASSIGNGAARNSIQIRDGARS